MHEKLVSTITDIAKGIAAGSFRSEAEISQGVVKNVLDKLGWPVYKTRIVTPEFKIGANKWVDYALCCPPDKAVILIEIKDLGKLDGKGEDQLFGYCGKEGVPLAVLTDGRIWSFYYIYGRGNYEDRLFAQIDLADDDHAIAAQTLMQYLKMEDVKSGAVRKRAEQDWERAWNQQEAALKFASVWNRLVLEPEPLLLDLFMEEVEKETRVKPDPERAAAFIRRYAVGGEATPVTPPTKSRGAGKQRPNRTQTSQAIRRNSRRQSSFTFQGQTQTFAKGVQVFVAVFEIFAEMDPDFCRRYSERYYGRSRKYVARTKEELFPTKPELRRTAAERLPGGWWLGTNLGNAQKKDRIKEACQVMGLEFGQDLQVEIPVGTRTRT